MSFCRIAQITDLHIHADRAATSYGRDTAATLAAVIAAIGREAGPLDLVLATGDLVDDGSPDAYRRLRPMLGALGVPVWVIPGNHDLAATIDETLIGDTVRRAHSVAAGAWRIVMLDSTLEGEVHGQLGPERLADLAAEIAAAREPHVLVALHHPPAPIGSPLDDIGLRDTQALYGVLDRASKVRALLWGHNHHAHDDMRNGVRRLGTPSTCVQFDSRPDVGFRRTDEPPAWRRLVLHDDGRIETEVVWVPLVG